MISLLVSLSFPILFYCPISKDNCQASTCTFCYTKQARKTGFCQIFHACFTFSNLLFIFIVVNKQECQQAYQSCQFHNQSRHADIFLSYHDQGEADNKNNSHDQSSNLFLHFCLLLSLSPPSVIPSVSLFCTQIYRTSTGIITITRPAYMIP